MSIPQHELVNEIEDHSIQLIKRVIGIYLNAFGDKYAINISFELLPCKNILRIPLVLKLRNKDIAIQVGVNILFGESKYWHTIGKSNWGINIENLKEDQLVFLSLFQNLKTFLDQKRGSLEYLFKILKPNPTKTFIPNQKINRAAYTILKILQQEPRLGKVNRFINNKYETWNSMIEADFYFYPYVNLTGSTGNHYDVKESWRKYALNYKHKKIPLSLYVHIPYCAQRCNFCHCPMSLFENKDEISNYIEQVCRELIFFSQEVCKIPVVTIFFGGGTPSIINLTSIEKLMKTITLNFNITKDCQLTIEGNPDSWTEKKLSLIHKYIPISRLVMGLQTIDPASQKIANRFNKKDKLIDLVKVAKKMEIKTVNIDLVAGLDGLSLKSFKKDLKFLRKVDPHIIDVYVFRPFKFSPNEKKISIDQQQILARNLQVHWAQKYLQKTLQNRFSVNHNKYLNHRNKQLDLKESNSTALLGVGVASLSYIPYELFYEVDNNLAVYNKSYTSVQYAFFESSLEEEMHAFMVKNINSGFSLDKFNNLFGKKEIESLDCDWQTLEELGLTIRNEKVSFSLGSLTNLVVARYFLASKSVRLKYAKLWQDDYDHKVNYYNQLDKIYTGEYI